VQNFTRSNLPLKCENIYKVWGQNDVLKAARGIKSGDSLSPPQPTNGSLRALLMVFGAKTW